MPHGPPEMLLPTTFAFADFWPPATTVPTIPERLISLERIFVPGESRTNTPAPLPTRSFPAMVVIEASIDSLDRVLAFGDASDTILHDRGARTERDNDAIGLGFRAAYNMVLRDSGVDAPGNADPQIDIAYDTISDNSSVTSLGNVDP